MKCRANAAVATAILLSGVLLPRAVSAKEAGSPIKGHHRSQLAIGQQDVQKLHRSSALVRKVPASLTELGGASEGDLESTDDLKAADAASRRRPRGVLPDMASGIKLLSMGITSSSQLNPMSWKHSEKVVFKDGIASIPQGGYIVSKFLLHRPTVVEAKIKSDAEAGVIAMSVFAEDGGASATYTLATGFGEDANKARFMPGDVQADMETDNNVEWQTVQFQLGESSTRVLLDDSVVNQNESSDVSRSEGYIRFMADSQPMQVKDVKWRLNCRWSEWQDSECSVSCGEGMMKRTRRVLQEATFGGAPCAGEAMSHEKCHIASCKEPVKPTEAPEEPAGVD